MTRLLLTATFFFLFASSLFAITAQEEQLIVRNALAVLGQATLQLPDTIPVKRICGTAALMEARERFDELSPRTQTALKPFLFGRPVLQKSYDPPSGRFRIHYDTAGPGAVRYASIRNAQGIPVWVDTLAMILDSVWNKEIVQLGFRPPVSDSFYSPNGGDGRRDVYLDEVGGGILGYTAPDSVGGVLGNRATAFMVLDNDYIGIPGYNTETEQRQVLRVTAAHEFFHTIQFAYNYFGFEVVTGSPKLYWQEATAVWMEDQMYNEINDYIQYLPFWFSRPEFSFRSFSSDFSTDPYRAFRPYALGIYGHYLSRRFPNPSYGYSVVRRIWERMATVSGFNLFAAIDYALGTEGSDFLTSLKEFYHWNYFVGRNSPLNVSFYAPEDSIWPSFDAYRRVDSTLNYPTRHPKIYIPCQSCHPNVIKFFCAPCTTNTIGFPCSTKCATACRFIPYQLSISTNCVNDLEDLGAAYLNLQNPGRGGAFMDLAIVSDTSRPAPFFASLARYNIGPPRSYGFITETSTDAFGKTPELFLAGIGNYSEVVATVANTELLPAGAARQTSAFAYYANVDSSTPPGFTEIVEGRPNPFRPGIDRLVKFPLALDSLSGNWDVNLLVFSPAGEIVYQKRSELVGGYQYREAVGWDGKNGSGESAASGVYFCKIIAEERGTSRKLEKFAKVALIRQ